MLVVGTSEQEKSNMSDSDLQTLFCHEWLRGGLPVMEYEILSMWNSYRVW